MLVTTPLVQAEGWPDLVAPALADSQMRHVPGDVLVQLRAGATGAATCSA
jgi:hypothetical protein